MCVVDTIDGTFLAMQDFACVVHGINNSKLIISPIQIVAKTHLCSMLSPEFAGRLSLHAMKDVHDGLVLDQT